MIDNQMLTVAGSVAGAVAVFIALLGGLTRIFVKHMSLTAAIIIAAMSVSIFSILVLSIDNRIKINQIREDHQ